MIQLQAHLFTDLEIGGPSAVRNALQQAIKLEHATIPLYLYALYSLDLAKNSIVSGVVRTVIIEEMLHMTLACNVLNALGGAPEIDTPKFIPTYPGPLPGGVESDLIAHLAPFSADQLCAFMKIEEPENPLHFPVVKALGTIKPPRTIGQFYAEIKRQISVLGSGAFSSTPRNQIGPDLMDGAIVVTDLKTAYEAIDTIVEQGEGTKESPLEAVSSQQFAHYYRFAEIHFGKRLIKNPDAGPETPPDKQYVYGGDAVPFDTTGVLPVPKDPLAVNYPAGSAARRACDTFNYTYTSLLRSLHAAFNGTPGELDSAIGLMMSVKQQARDMMSGKLVAGVNVGPSFEYQAVEPG